MCVFPQAISFLCDTSHLNPFNKYMHKCTNKKNKYAIHTQRHQSCVCVSFTVQKDMWSG